MKAYIFTTGILFGLIAIMHLIRAIDEFPAMLTDPKYFFGMASLGVVAAGLSGWAWRLLSRRIR